MCGLAGILTNAGRDEQFLTGAARRMAATLVHRGPDDHGAWCDPAAGIAFGFRRLSIVDLSEAGHQPMHSSSGRFTLVFNGEVYNHAALRHELESTGVRFRGHSDSEVILAAVERWGAAAAVQRFIGMFAIAIWDAELRTLTLIRDRLGIKPLFIYRQPGLITFASELKAIAAGPEFDRTINPNAVADMLRLLYVPGSATIYRHAIKLLPGHMITIRSPDLPLPEPVPYWSVESVAEQGLADPFRGSDEEMIDELDQILTDSVRLRRQADVPVGALLSGGIDSSLVVALLQETSDRAVKTFSVAFDRKEHNEAEHAARVAAHLGTDHTEVMLTGDDALAVVPRLADIFDEPNADASQIPCLLICEVARREVAVALSGDGGDEVFGGYQRYSFGNRLLPRMMRIPGPARRLAAAGISHVPAASWDRAHTAITPVLPSALRQRFPGEKLHKVARLMGFSSMSDMYGSLISAWSDSDAIVLDATSRVDPVGQILDRSSPADLVNRMMLFDQLNYMVDDQLAKVDRVSMATSLELRVPLIDHRAVEFSWRIPAGHKIRQGQGKWPLRQVLYRRVPRPIIDRPKMGFSVPLADWLRGPLRPWAEALLEPDRIGREGVLRAAPIRAQWAHLLAGADEGALGIWSVLMFQAWHERRMS